MTSANTNRTYTLSGNPGHGALESSLMCYVEGQVAYATLRITASRRVIEVRAVILGMKATHHGLLVFEGNLPSRIEAYRDGAEKLIDLTIVIDRQRQGGMLAFGSHVPLEKSLASRDALIT